MSDLRHLTQPCVGPLKYVKQWIIEKVEPFFWNTKWTFLGPCAPLIWEMFVSSHWLTGAAEIEMFDASCFFFYSLQKRSSPCCFICGAKKDHATRMSKNASSDVMRCHWLWQKISIVSFYFDRSRKENGCVDAGGTCRLLLPQLRDTNYRFVSQRLSR